MIHCKITEDGCSRPEQTIHSEFYDETRNLGLDYFHSASSKLFTNDVTQRLYENWCKSTGKKRN